MNILRIQSEPNGKNIQQQTSNLKLILSSISVVEQYNKIRLQTLQTLPDPNTYKGSTLQVYLPVRHLKLDKGYRQTLRFIKRYVNAEKAVWVSL